jgi:transketolase
MRDGFKAGIFEVAARDSTVHLLTGDHGYGLFDEFRNAFPERFHNVGVAESNLVGIAAGLAKSGLRPVIYGLAAFVPNRVFEFIKLQIATTRLPVTIVGDGAGLVYSHLGKSHQTLEDLSIIGSLEQIHTLSPGSDAEMRIGVNWCLRQPFPTYLRMGKMGGNYSGAAQSESPTAFRVSSCQIHEDLAIVAHGSMVSGALDALDSSDGLKGSFDLWSCPTVFPVESSFLMELRKYRKVLVIEEHQKRGGLADELRREMGNFGPDVFSLCANSPEFSRIGDYSWALAQHGLSQEAITLFLHAHLH